MDLIALVTDCNFVTIILSSLISM